MKKIFSLLFIAIAMLGLSIGLTACGEHDHDVVEWHIDIAATCTQKGSASGDCTICGEHITREIDLLPHETYVSIAGTEPTCENPGMSDQISCHSCNHIIEEQHEIAATGHDWQNEVIVEEPTCEHVGQKTYTCSKCSQNKSEEIPTTPHTYIENWITILEADCEADGIQQRTCTVCNKAKETRTIPAKQHDWGEWKQDDEDGYHKRVCNNNPEHIDRQICTYSTITQDSTCTEPGRVYKKCSTCQDEVDIQSLDPKGHQYNNVYHEKVIEQGDMVTDVAGPHKHVHYQTCVRCGENSAEEDCESNPVHHDPTCTKPGYDEYRCSKCGSLHEVIDEEEPAQGHSIAYRQLYVIGRRHQEYCTKCNYVKGYALCSVQHISTPATCTTNDIEEDKCLVCEYVWSHVEVPGSALGHLYPDDYTLIGDKDHPQHKRECERCQNEEIGDCVLVDANTLSTCDDAGEIKQVCKICQRAFVLDTPAALGHDYNEQPYQKYNDEQDVRYCSRCGKPSYEEHSFSTTYTPANCTDPETTIKHCDKCDTTVTQYGQAALGHIWHLSEMSETKHKGQCQTCQIESDDVHDFSESNICSVCGYDGLEYRFSGLHCYVKSDDKVKNAKYIVIPSSHKRLVEGVYEKTEYDVLGIDDYAFMSNNSILEVHLPYTLTTIGRYAFSDCENLKNVYIIPEYEEEEPEKLKESELLEIYESAFSRCLKLESFMSQNPPKKLKTIGNSAFRQCYSLNKIEVGDSVMNIGLYAFNDTGYIRHEENWVNDALYLGKHLIKVRQTLQGDGSYTNSTFEIATGTLSVANNAFEDCKYLKKITLPSSLKKVGMDAFLKCEGIEQVTFLGSLHEWLAIEFENDLSSPLYYGNAGLHLANVEDTLDLTQYENIRYIPAGTFKNSALKSIILPKSVIYIGEEAFENCANLTSVTIAEGGKISYVGKNAFLGSGLYETWLKSDEDVLYVAGVLIKVKDSFVGALDIQAGTTAVADNAAEGCKGITSIKINRDLLHVGIDAFFGCSGVTTATFEDTSSTWLFNIKDSIGRWFTGNRLNWDNIKNYHGGWTKVLKQ